VTFAAERYPRKDPSGGRAERIQQIFSLEYHPAWERPQPR
jgi:hypothetical protein